MTSPEGASPPPHRRLAGLALALGTTFVMLLALEGVARVARQVQGWGLDEGGAAFYTEYDPLLGWRKRPGSSVAYRRPEYRTEVAINRQGLRDPERAYASPPGVVRVLALGDSFVEGYTVPLAEAVTQVLERELREGGRAVEVINGGTTAYATDQEYLFYESEGARYGPRVVVLFFHYNDIVYNARQVFGAWPKPILIARDGFLRLHKYPVPERARTRETEEEPPPAAGGSALKQWVADRLRNGAPETYNRLARFGFWPESRPVGARLELRVYQSGRIPEIEDAWESTANVLAGLAGAVEARGARLLVAYVPSRLEVSERAWRLSRFRNGMDEENWDRSLVRLRLRTVTSRLRIPFLDLTDALRDGEGLLGGAYFVYDVHWSPLGHALAAREVQRFLERERWLEGSGPEPQTEPSLPQALIAPGRKMARPLP